MRLRESPITTVPAEKQFPGRGACCRGTGATTLALRGLDGKLLRLYVEDGTSGSGATTWLEDVIWADGTLLATVSADPDGATAGGPAVGWDR